MPVVSFFRPELLPSPRAFYEQQFGSLRRVSRGWCTVACPFHNDHDPSLSINVDHGGYFCFACNARGGDILDFVRDRDNLAFREAAIALGAWRDGSLSLRELREASTRKRHRGRLERAASQLAAAERTLRLRYRTQIHALERARDELSQKLSAIQQGRPEQNPAEAERCWALLARILDAHRVAVAGYYVLAFAGATERASFILFPKQRTAIVAKTLDRGYVVDIGGHLTEVNVG